MILRCYVVCVLVFSLLPLTYGRARRKDAHVDITDQTTVLDGVGMRAVFRFLRSWMFDVVGRTGQRMSGSYLQEQIPSHVPFPCNITLGRSTKVPTSVHKLRPGDINVIAAMGDSLTAATGAAASGFIDLYQENRGLSWSIGGQWDWRNVTTLPNILKVFNPKLVGYSLGDAYPFHRESQFNMAEIGAVSYDIPYMARAMVQRIRNDPRVDWKRDWKLVTIAIGGNDICSFVCTMRYPEQLPAKHRLRLQRTLRYLRDNMPRTFVNLVSIPSVSKVVMLQRKPFACESLHHGECSCWIGKLYSQSNTSRERWGRIQDEYIKMEKEIAESKEFRGLDEFAVVYQPWSLNVTMKMNGKDIDYSLLSYDCFHMSQKGNAYAGTALWNNMLESVGKKTSDWRPLFKNFKCPTKEAPYLVTYDNSGHS
ncbi:phospholipase B1, membrane-associated-like isoform X2 [Anopheles funestus]|uniref:SGNH hydrolase-type esterase domain-containing protein n=1 Tax=Anopheles funestus TaxID=62324 RepID=A0A182R8K1_ANOFN|nr:phospholipase B1, membrane-associated-like isoform X2 [Anopheles funestus]